MMLPQNEITAIYDTGDAEFLTSKQCRARYGGISDTTLWRWTTDATLGFPKPVRIGLRKNFWSRAELDAFDARLRAERNVTGGEAS